MTLTGAQRAPPSQVRAVQRRLVASSVLLLCIAVLGGPLCFSVAPGNAPRAPAISAVERLEVPRGQAEPRTQMRGRYSTGTRSKKNQQGGGNLPMTMNRRPVLAYAVDIPEPKGDGTTLTEEPAWSVLRRAWDMYDLDYNRMAAERQRYVRSPPQRRKWRADWNMRAGRRRKELRIKRQYETDWLEWMRRNGKAENLTTPVTYSGPPLKGMGKSPVMSQRILDGKVGWTEMQKWKKEMGPGIWKNGQFLPVNTDPGKFNDDGPDNIFKVWRRPLCKYPFDIRKRGKNAAIVHSQVMR